MCGGMPIRHLSAIRSFRGETPRLRGRWPGKFRLRTTVAPDGYGAFSWRTITDATAIMSLIIFVLEYRLGTDTHQDTTGLTE